MVIIKFEAPHFQKLTLRAHVYWRNLLVTPSTVLCHENARLTCNGFQGQLNANWDWFFLYGIGQGGQGK
jgi:hypothetical protein